MIADNAANGTARIRADNTHVGGTPSERARKKKRTSNVRFFDQLPSRNDFNLSLRLG